MRYLTEAATQLFAVDGVVGCLLVVEAGMLGLNSSQAKFNGFIKKIAKHLEPVTSKDSLTDKS